MAALIAALTAALMAVMSAVAIDADHDESFLVELKHSGWASYHDNDLVAPARSDRDYTGGSR